MSRSLRQRERSRSTLIAALLITSLLLVAVLTFQTQYAVSAHYRLAEEVLRGYASLVADEFIRRSSVEVGYYGFYPLVSLLSSEAALPDVAELRASDNPRVVRASALAAAVFEYDQKTGVLTGSIPGIGESEREWLTGQLAAARSHEEPYVIARSRIAGEMFQVVYTLNADSSSIRGLVVDNAKIPEWLETAANRQPLLPPSLSHDELANDQIYVELVAEGGESLFRQGRSAEGALFVEKPFATEGPTLFEDMKVRAAIAPPVAARLVIGGMPESRLPALLGLWALAALLIVLAIGLLRRERALARLRSDFVSRVSHELRTPLTQIRMFAETLLLDRVRSDEERRRSLEVIDKEARRLAHLVENILQFSRSERGTVTLDLRPRPVFALVRELADDFRPMLQSGRLVVSSEVSDEVLINVDEEAFRQMLINLLDNAVKYGPGDQEIHLTLSVAEGRVSVAVEDQGPGIPEAERERIWQPYYRTRSRARSAVAGTGIGLAVVHELARLHGAEVGARPGKSGGTRFFIAFPELEQ